MRKVVLLLIIILFASSCRNPREKGKLTNDEKIVIEEPQLFQDKLQESINKVQSATVMITTHELLAGVRGMSASGVSVSADGIIITAGHMVIPGGDYSITYPNGKEFPAVGLGKIGTLDLGLLKITEEGVYPYAEMGYSSSLEVGDCCFSLAYPGSFTAKMVARLGKVASLKDGQFGFLRTTCLMEPGDSGGPVFDMDGKVIAIRSYIGMSLDENYDVPIDFHREYWTALQKAIEYRFYPAKDSINYPKDTEDSINYNEVAFKNRMGNLVNSIVSISSKRNQSEKTILGFFVDLDELIDRDKVTHNGYVISKSSEVLNNPIIKAQNQVFNDAKILYRDFDRDLVLIGLGSKPDKAIDVQDIVNKDIEEGDVGEIIYSPIYRGDGLISVVGTSDFKLFGKYSTGYLGTRVELKNGKNIVISVQPNSAAEDNSLTVGDELVSINNVDIDQPSTLIAELKKTKPFETVTLVRVKDGLKDSLKIELKVRPYKGIDHISEEFEGGRSDRRDGFEKIFIHDACLKPAECGGPIVNVDGKVVGVNMARYSRTSSIGLSGKEVNEFLRNVIDKLLTKYV